MSRCAHSTRVAAVLIAGALALWISIGVTLNFAIAERRPDLAREWWPDGVTPAVVTAGRFLSSPTARPGAVVQAQASLRSAALREPLSSYALGMLGAMAEFEHNKTQARALFQLSEDMSRRNLLTEMWLIEDAVADGNVSKAISRYNRVMLVSNESRTTLLPVLVSAASEPEVFASLLPILTTKPLWWRDFVRVMTVRGNDPALMSAVIVALKPNLADQDERTLAEGVLSRMIVLDAEKRALQTVNRLEGKAGAYRNVQGGNFDRNVGLLPFAWWLRQDDNIQAYLGIVPDGSDGLWFDTRNDTGGVVAKQLIGLESGQYIFSGLFGVESLDIKNELFIELSCGKGRLIKNFSLPSGGRSRKKFQFEFQIPTADCATQWVKFRSILAGEGKIWFDNIIIEKSNRQNNVLVRDLPPS